MSGHTPGPWWFGIHKWDDDCNQIAHPKPPTYSGEGYSENPSIYGADGTEVVGCDEYDVFGDCCGDDARREADIRLILSAPELLAALVHVVDAWTSQFERNGAIAPPWCAEARNAIAKATQP